MIKEVYVSEETIALAKHKACELLSADEQNVQFEIIQAPTKKTLGIFGGKVAQVRAYLKQTPIDIAVEFTKEMLYYMGFEYITVTVEAEGKNIYKLKLDGENINRLVGYHGETLDAIQYIIGLIANNSEGNEPYCTIRVEAGDYRDRRKASLENLAKKLCESAKNFNRRIALEPMRSYERKLIHDTVKEIDGVISKSEGLNNYRHVVIYPTTNKTYHENHHVV